MTPRVLAPLTLTIAVLACSPAPRERRGSPGELAAYRAELFAYHAIVRQDFESAYRLLQSDDRGQTTPADLEHDLRQQHTGSFPTRVVGRQQN